MMEKSFILRRLLMPKYAIVYGNRVSNVIIADSLEDANELAVAASLGDFAVQVSKDPGSPDVGWTWDGTQLIHPPMGEPDA